ncbi:MAG: hypothetical protein CVV05_00730 [Gammaproteobacteria bacterium HGW-Gammaproteobacteria-1]|jgi:hypothetical protein|nr:MAG: hypothetical protein CVV05_00730 [Gammaproteobacteria bacterium HGW-Gammaproteobacteria-1]
MSLDKETPRAADTLGTAVDLDAEFAGFLGNLNEELAAMDEQSDAVGMDGVVIDEGNDMDAAPEIDGEPDITGAGHDVSMVHADASAAVGMIPIAGEAGSLPEVEDVPWREEGADLSSINEEADDLGAAPAADAPLDDAELLPPMEADEDLDALSEPGTMLPGLDVGDQVDVDAGRLAALAPAVAEMADIDDFSDDLSVSGEQTDFSLFASEAPADDELPVFPDTDDDDEDLPAPGMGSDDDAIDGDEGGAPPEFAIAGARMGLRNHGDDDLDVARLAEPPPMPTGLADEEDAANLSDSLHDIPDVDVAAFNPYRGEGVPADADEGVVSPDEEDSAPGDFHISDDEGFDAFADEGAAFQEAGTDEVIEDGIDDITINGGDTLSLDAPLAEADAGEEEGAGKQGASKMGTVIFFVVAAVLVVVVGSIVVSGLSPNRPAPRSAQPPQPTAMSETSAFAPEPSGPSTPSPSTAPSADLAVVPEPIPAANEPAPLFAPTPVSALESAPVATPVSTEPATPVHANPPGPTPAPVELSRSVDLTPQAADSAQQAVATAPTAQATDTLTLEEMRQVVASALNTEPLPNDQLAKVLERLKSVEAQQKEILLNLRRSNQQHVEATRRPAAEKRPVPKTASATYELMGAAAGKAVVRTSDGKTRVVSVGQVLDGLGRVTRIEAHGCLYHEHGVLTTRSASCK